jgi:hypothetical protein
METEKGDIILRSEQYGMWTIPSITMNVEENENQETDKGHVVSGARLVNHLANRVADTMFPHDRPFFTLALTPEAEQQLAEEVGEEELGKLAEIVRSSTAKIEKVGMRMLHMTAYRPVAVMALKHMIISGNAVLKRMKDGTRVVYGVRDFMSRRGLNGELRECILRDAKLFGNLPKTIRDKMLETRPEYKHDTQVVLLSHYLIQDDGRWSFQQAADNVMLSGKTFFTEVDLPILDLTWSLARGEHYGRGLVEDNAIAFHNLDVLTAAMIDLLSAMADIKFLVNPASVLDVDYLNQSARGSYHTGKEGDITVPEIGKRGEVQVMMEAINKWERDLSQAFLLNSAGVRDAERVTAEEIRMNARELESAYGGLYSKLASHWQQRESEWAIKQVNISDHIGTLSKMFEVIVVTGLESLSREGQLDNLRLAIGDMQMLEAVPEELRGTINPLLFASFVFTNRGVRLKDFMYTQAEITSNQQAAQQQQEQLMQAQANANVAEEGGKAAMQSAQS